MSTGEDRTVHPAADAKTAAEMPPALQSLMTPGKAPTVRPGPVEWVAGDATAAAEMLAAAQRVADQRRTAAAEGHAVDPDARVVVLVDEASHLLAAIDRDGKTARNARELVRDLMHAARTDYPITTDDVPGMRWRMPVPPLDSETAAALAALCPDTDPAAPGTDAEPRE